jgi:DNA-binding transcriptional ArsR family regulator
VNVRSNVFKALSHPIRRDVLKYLRDGPVAAGDLAKRFDVSWPTMSRHMSVLKDAGLVTTERVGTSVRYHINTTVLEDAAGALLALVEPRAVSTKAESAKL